MFHHTKPKIHKQKRTLAAFSAAVLGATTLALVVPSAAVAEPTPNSPWPDDYEHPSSVRLVSQLTGAKGLTNTLADWAVGGTDLGLMWDNGAGEILFAIGDTFGQWSGGGGGGGDWRSNALLRSSNSDWNTKGMILDSAASDVAGRAKEIIPSLKSPGVEHTTIPTGGIAVDGRQYLSFMSVNHWGDPGEWFTNYSRIAYSDDNGQTWNSTDGPQWDNDDAWGHKFQMVAFAHGQGDGYVYMFGTQNGRFGPLHLARVAEDQILDKDAYTYWDGANWAVEDTAATEIVPAAVTELSVQYNEYLGKWMMMYMTDSADMDALEIVFRTADSPEGPWSEPTAVATSLDLPGMYSPYLHPWNEGPEVHFTLSLWGPYNVFQYAFTLDPEGNVINPNLLKDPSFSRSAPGAMSDAWACNGNCGIDHNTSWAYGSEKQAYLRHNSGWIDLYQPVTVEPHTRYLLTAFVVTGPANHPDTVTGEVGVRGTGPGASVLAKTEFQNLPTYTRQQVEFDSGDQTNLEVYTGTNLDRDRWVQSSSYSLVKIGEGEQPPTPTVIEQIEAPSVVQATECGIEATLIVPQDQDTHRYEQVREGTTVTVKALTMDGYVFADGLTTQWPLDVAGTTCPPTPQEFAGTLNVSATKAKAGDKITVSGTKWSPDSDVKFELHSKVVSLGATAVAADGSFTAQITVPQTVTAGSHQLKAIQGENVVSVALEIASATPDPADGGKGGKDGAIANTGATVAAVSVLALALLGAGAMLRLRLRK